MDIDKEILTRPQDVVTELENKKEKFKISHEDAEAQYFVENHAVFDETKRPNKIIKVYRGDGREGKPIYETTTQEVTRIGLNYQKLIVERLIGLMLGNKIRLTHTVFDDSVKDSKLFKYVKKVWSDTKMDFRNREVLRRLLSEMEVAEYWYVVKRDDPILGEQHKFKMKLFSPFEGDTLMPYFDDSGDMVAFGRGYVTENEQGDNIQRVDLWTPKFQYFLVEGKSGYIHEKLPKPNVSGKIPIAYYRQPAPEWFDVQTTCERQETLVSNFADTNDYFASPMIKLKGKVKGFADKGEQGKIISLTDNADVSYLTWDSGPEAIKTEFDMNEELIFNGTQIPNISFSKIKGFTHNSNALFKLLFSDPHMKTETKWEVFGMGIQRRLNIISRLVAGIYGYEEELPKVVVSPIMNPYMPKNTKEDIDTLNTATNGNKVLSRKRAVELNSMVENPAQELEAIEQEEEKEALQTFGGESFS